MALFTFVFPHAGLVQGLSIDIKLKDTQRIEEQPVTTITDVGGGDGVGEPVTSKYYRHTQFIIIS